MKSACMLIDNKAVIVYSKQELINQVVKDLANDYKLPHQLNVPNDVRSLVGLTNSKTKYWSLRDANGLYVPSKELKKSMHGGLASESITLNSHCCDYLRAYQKK